MDMMLKSLRKFLRYANREAFKRAEEQALLSVYMDALANAGGYPLGKAALLSEQRSSSAAAMVAASKEPAKELAG